MLPDLWKNQGSYLALFSASPNMKFTSGLAAILVSSAVIVMVQPPQVVLAQSATQVANAAKQFTVLIEGQNPGSGVIIKRDGNTYTVLTARHVVATPDEYNIITPDGQKYRLNYSTVKPLSGVDLAVLEFTSTRPYPVARLGNSRNTSSGTTVYVAGFPAPTATITQSFFSFLDGKIIANADQPLADGYALIYSNNTSPGMSGGAVLNDAGEVIGIHGKADATTANNNVARKTDYNLGIPIHTFLSLMRGFSVAVAAPSPTSPTNQPNPNPNVDNLYLQAVNKLSNFDDRGAIADLDRVLRLNPNRATAYRDRALARVRLNDNAGACADLDRSLQLDAQDGLAYSRRAGSPKDVRISYFVITNYSGVQIAR
jgi:hypothetical protein